LNALLDRRPEQQAAWAGLMRCVLDNLARLTRRSVRRHLYSGFLLRSAMIERSLDELAEQLGRGGESLSPSTSTFLTLHLNSYYFNLCRSLDNLSWALIYQFRLLREVDENRWEHQQFAALHRKPLLSSLENRGQPGLAVLIRDFQDWCFDLRTLRDPAALGIPLNIPPVLCGATNPAGQGRPEGGLKDAAESLRPWIMREPPGTEVLDPHRRISRDQEQWLALAGVVVNGILTAMG
jgi:hypothetical protein